MNHTTKLGIVTDGKYGERAFENIREVFECEWILLEEIPASVMLDDDYELDIVDCDLYISYLRHPDQVFALAELEKPTLLGISFGLGFFRQLQEINATVLDFPTMCSVEPITGIPEIDKFAHHFGCPVFETEVEDGLIKKVNVIRSSPCGSSKVGPDYIKGKPISVKTFQDFAIHVCHECRAPRFGQTCDKELSGIIHIRSMVKSIEESYTIENEEVLSFIDNINQEYNNRLKKQGLSSMQQVA
ncbi:MAG: hypothetical protein EAX96_01095 [Candidatus Lokiarchaeota archaeon]|nr:hypothetical protein [Candidatus Lokiarchaeota archaeon]